MNSPRERPNNSDDRATLVRKSEIFKEIARYEDMMHCMRTLVEQLGTARSDRLDEHERTMLSIAYKHVAGARRSSWKAVLKAERAESNTSRAQRARVYREEIAEELRSVCLELIGLIDDNLLPSVKMAEDDIFYHKMKGDYYRYLAEVEVDDEKKAHEYIEKAGKNYIGAATYAGTDLAPTHPIRLGLVLNFSVFLHEMKGEKEAALEMAQKAYDEAVDEMETVKDVDETRYGEAANLIILLEDNIKACVGTSAAKGDHF